MKNLVPGSQYDFEVYATSDCGNSLSAYLKGGTTVKGEHYFPDDFDIHCTVAFVIQIQFLNGNFFSYFSETKPYYFWLPGKTSYIVSILSSHSFLLEI